VERLRQLLNEYNAQTLAGPITQDHLPLLRRIAAVILDEVEAQMLNF